MPAAKGSVRTPLVPKVSAIPNLSLGLSKIVDGLSSMSWLLFFYNTSNRNGFNVYLNPSDIPVKVFVYSLGQSKPIIIMISHIMIIQFYHIISITDNKPKTLSYHLEIWYLDWKTYHVLSKVIFTISKFIISYWKLYFNLKLSYHIENYISTSKLSYHIKNDISMFNIFISYQNLY